MTTAEKQTYGFETEVSQLLDLVVHSLYSNKEIFLRELISNSSDACDKLRFKALEDNSLYANDSELGIHVLFDEKARTITVSDNGIGMTREEIISHLGTIAKSGTKEFLSQLTKQDLQDSNLIGQFGVGFYSVFMVADKVTVDTLKAGHPATDAVRWESKGDGQYTIEPIRKVTRGTTVTLRLKADESEFLSDWRLRSIITKYSDHISWPVKMRKIKSIEDAAEAEGQDGADHNNPALEEEIVNKATALWTRPKNSITDNEYKEFYKHISHDVLDPLAWIHNNVEGKQNYISLLFIPARAPFDLWQQDVKHGIKLYVKRVFIMDEADQFLPRYLRFVKGVIDSSDLPLNVSREILQDNKLVESIRSASTKRILSLLEKLAQDEPQKYQEFWREFGLVLKEGPVEDYANREQIAKLLRFSSTYKDSNQQEVSLDEYISRMKENQDKIYYISAESFRAAQNSPQLEIFRKQGIEVLLLYDRIDEWLTGHLAEYQGKKLISVTKGKLDLGELNKEDPETKEEENKDEKLKDMLERIKTVLGDKVKEVRWSQRLTTSPACVVVDDSDMGFEMQRLLKAAGHKVPDIKPILELNSHNPLLMQLREESDQNKFIQWSNLLLEQAILAEGGHLEDPGLFVKRLNEMWVGLTS